MIKIKKRPNFFIFRKFLIKKNLLFFINFYNLYNFIKFIYFFVKREKLKNYITQLI